MGLLIKLQDGDTAFKSLKFGNDRPGGGDSGQPYIKTPIDKPNTPALNSDFLLRGGISAPLNAAEDVARLTKYFFDFKNPSGLLFTAKQNLLSRTGTKTEASKGIGYAGGLINEGIYTPLSTIAEAGVVAFGGHLNKQGLDPTGLLSSLSIKKYQDVVFENNQLEKNSTDLKKYSNRLLDLWNTHGLTPSDNLINQNTSTSINFPTLYQYGGGPSSTLGIGNTKIRFATGNDGQVALRTNRFNKSDLTKKSPHTETNLFMSFTSVAAASTTYTDLTKKPVGIALEKEGRKSWELPFYPSVYLDNTTGSLTPKKDLNSYLVKKQHTPLGIEDFPQPIAASTKYNEIKNYKGDQVKYELSYVGKPYYGINYLTSVYNSGSLTPRTDIKEYNTLNQAKINSLSSTRRTTVYTASIKELGNKSFLKDPRISTGSKTIALDKINATPIYNSTKSAPNDSVNFRIGIVNPQTPTNTKYISFRSFIDNFSDSYTAEWDAQKYMGRAESFYKYNGFGREISIGFTVAVQSKAEMTTIYNKLNYLASSLAPTYTSQGYMAGNLSKITVGTYIYEQYGIIKSLSYDIPDESPWEIISDELPMIIKATMAFTPIHNFRPEVGEKFLAQK